MRRGTGSHRLASALTRAISPDVLAALRSSSTTLLIMNSNAAGAASPGTPQYAHMFSDLGQPATDVFIAADSAQMNTAAEAVVARIHVLTGL